MRRILLVLPLILVACGDDPQQVVTVKPTTTTSTTTSTTTTTTAPPSTIASRASRRAPQPTTARAAPAPAQAPPAVATQAGNCRKIGGRTYCNHHEDIFDDLAHCESTHSNPDGRYDGYFQFDPPTWNGLGYSGYAYQYDYGTQKAAAKKLVARSGWGQFPFCSRLIGAR
jgi:resuscitation-promoting factor RpfB